jgi:hypothetical protein
MLQRRFYWILGVGVLVIIFAIAISGGTAKPSTQPQDTADIPHDSAPTAVPQFLAASSAAATIRKVEAASSAHFGVRSKTLNCVANQPLPDPACSPGAVLTTDSGVICVYTQTVRGVPISEKQQVFAEYGLDWSEHGDYEVDHIISLELGGSNDISNLYPESYLDSIRRTGQG